MPFWDWFSCIYLGAGNGWVVFIAPVLVVLWLVFEAIYWLADRRRQGFGLIRSIDTDWATVGVAAVMFFGIAVFMWAVSIPSCGASPV
jgi:hypothetical protein